MAEVTAMNLAPIGATIPASEIRPGYVLDLGLPSGETFPVERIEVDGEDVRVSKLPAPYTPRWYYLGAAQQVKVGGYFNPEST